MTQFFVFVSFFQWNNRLLVNCFQFFESGLVQIFVASFGFNIENFVNMGSGSNFCWRGLEKWLLLKIYTKKFREINIFLQLISFSLSVYLSSSWSTFGSSNSGTTYFLAFLAGSSCFTDFIAFLACCLAKLKLAVTLKILQWQFHKNILYRSISESNFTEKPTGNKSPRLQTLVQYLHVHVVCIRIFYFGLHQLAI